MKALVITSVVVKGKVAKAGTVIEMTKEEFLSVRPNALEVAEKVETKVVEKVEKKVVKKKR